MGQGEVFPRGVAEMSELQERCRVLVVDDEVRLADSMVGILTAGGYDAVAAYSAEAAMKHADRLNPDVVISDIVMGPVSGIELANHVRERFPDCRILLMSGIATRDDLGRQSAVRFLPKPISPERLLEFVNACRPVAAAQPTATPVD
jgi:DNA-binding NtrC family response regulator